MGIEWAGSVTMETSALYNLAGWRDRIPAGSSFVAALQAGDVRVLLFQPRSPDEQAPHPRDELYIIAEGAGRLHVGFEQYPFSTGDLLFVPATLPHHFELDPDSRVCAWVVFLGTRMDGAWTSNGTDPLHLEISPPESPQQVWSLRWRSSTTTRQGIGLGHSAGMLCVAQSDKQDAGLVQYRRSGDSLRVLWAHPMAAGKLEGGQGERTGPGDDFDGVWRLVYTWTGHDPLTFDVTIEVTGATATIKWRSKGALVFTGAGFIVGDDLLAAWGPTPGFEAVLYRVPGADEPQALQGRRLSGGEPREETLYRR